MKKWEIQVIVFIIRLTYSSEKNFNPMRYTGYTYTDGCIQKISTGIKNEFVYGIKNEFPSGRDTHFHPRIVTQKRDKNTE